MTTDRFLLDTHAALWWWRDSPNLGARARATIANPDSIIFVSAASAWEIATKWRIGKLDDIGDPAANYKRLMVRNGFSSLAVTEDHTLRAGILPGEHRDPFDRLIAAQALIEQLTVLTRDIAIAAFGCKTDW